MKTLLLIAALLFSWSASAGPVFNMLLNQIQPANPFPANILSHAPDVWLSAGEMTYTNGTAPAYIADRSGNHRWFYNTNGTGAVVTNGSLHFNGTNSFLQVADFRWPTPGGIATTGVCRDPRDNTMLLGDFITGNFIRVDLNGRLLETITTSIGVSNLQGIAINTNTWNIFACATATSNVFEISSTGTTISQTNFTGNFKPNGIAFDGTNLWLSSNLDINLHSYSTAFVSNRTISVVTVAADGLCINTNGMLLITQDGLADGASAIIEVDPADGTPIRTNQVPFFDAIEHLAVMEDGTMRIGVDDDFHDVDTQTDYIGRLRQDGTLDALTDGLTNLTIIASIRPSATMTATRPIVFVSVATNAATARAALFGGLTSGKVSAVARNPDTSSSATATGATTIGTTTNTLVAGVYHFTATDGIVYVAGASDGSNTSFLSAVPSTTTLTNSVQSFRIGGSASAFFDGQIQDVLVFRRALDSTEISLIKEELQNQ